MCCRPGGFAGGIDGLLYLGAGCRWYFQHRVGRGEPQLERYVGLEPGPGTDRGAAWRVADAAAPAAGYDAADLCRRVLDAVPVRARHLRIVRTSAVPRNGMGLAACLQYPEPDLFVCFSGCASLRRNLYPCLHRHGLYPLRNFPDCAGVCLASDQQGAQPVGRRRIRRRGGGRITVFQNFRSVVGYKLLYLAYF